MLLLLSDLKSWKHVLFRLIRSPIVLDMETDIVLGGCNIGNTVVDPILCRVVSLEKKRHKIEMA